MNPSTNTSLVSYKNYSGIRYSVPHDVWKDALLNSPLPHLNYLPKEALSRASASISTKFNVHYFEQTFSALYLFVRNLPHCDFLLETSLECGDLSCYLGLGKVKRSSETGIIRGLDNLALGAALVWNFKLQGDAFDIICRPHSPKDQSMPEAVWKFALMRDGTCFARIGINFHHECGEIVASITNIQGLKKDVIKEVRTLDAIWPVTAVQWIVDNLPREISVIRGMNAACHPSLLRGRLLEKFGFSRYNRTFRHAGFEAVRLEDSSLQFYEINRRTNLKVSTSPSNAVYLEVPRSRLIPSDPTVP